MQKEIPTAIRKSSNWGDFLNRLEQMYPVYETNPSVRTEIEELPPLPEFPTAARISEFVAQSEELMGRMDPSSYGPTEPHLWLVGKIPTRTWDNCRETSEIKARTHSYDDPVDPLIELAMERENDSHMDKYLHEHLRRETPAEKSPGGRSPQPHSNPGKGPGGQLKHLTEAPPSKGKGAPNLFYCRPTSDKGGPRHAPDCDGRSTCMLQLKRTQKTKHGQEVKHQDHFRCTIMCGYCGKRRHYEDECHIKRRESEKHKKAEEERRKTAGKGGGAEGGGANHGGFKGKGNPGERRSSAPPTGGRGAPNPTPKGEPLGEKGPAPSTPSAGGADKSSENAKKRHLNWHSKCLQAAGVEVKFPEEGQAGGCQDEDLVFWITVKIGDQVYKAVLYTGATLSIVTRRLLKQAKIRKTKTVAIRVGDGRTIHSLGGVDETLCLGDEQVTQHCKVLDTDAFDIVIGTDFLRRNHQVKLLSLQRPYALDCDFGSGLVSVPLELSGRKESGLRYVNRSYRTENYQLVRPVFENGLAALLVDLNEVQLELFASKEQHMMQLYCSRYLNNAYRFYWKLMGLCYANPPFSQLAKVLTKIALEGARVVLCTPDWGTTGEHAYWRRLLDRMTVGRTELPNGPIHVPEDSQETMPAPEWGSFLSIVEAALNPVPVSELDQVVLKELMAENRGLTLLDLKKRSEFSSVTTTSGECSDEQETPAVSSPLADADDRLSDIASAIPRVDPEIVTLKHSAFLALLLMNEVDLGQSTHGGSHDHAVFSGQATDGPTGQVPGAKPSPNNMPVSWYDVRDLQQVFWAKAEGMERRTRLDLLKRTWKTSIWSEEEDEEMTLPDPEVPLVYSLHYAQQGCQDWEDELPPKTMGRMKKQEKGKSNLHAEEDYVEKLGSMNLDPCLSKLIQKHQEVLGALPPRLSYKKLVQMDLKLKAEFEGSVARRRPYPAPQDQINEIVRQIQECIDAGLVEENKHGDYSRHCSPCFLVAKSGSTAMRLVVDYGEVNKKTQNHSGSIPNMENTLERIVKCGFKTKMDKRNGFWQVDLTRAAQKLLTFVTPKGRVFRWKVMPFGVANAPALFQELMNKILYILRRRPLVQELVSRGAEMEAHIDDVSLSTNTQKDHILLLQDFFTACQENHLRIKLEKCEFMREEMEYLGFNVGYGWWKPAASKMQPLQDVQIRDDPKKGLHDVRSFIGACNFYRCHIHNFTYSSAPLTDPIKKTNPWR